jgi:hypothetical protein
MSFCCIIQFTNLAFIVQHSNSFPNFIKWKTNKGGIKKVFEQVGKSAKQSSQFANNEKDLRIPLKKYVEFLAATDVALVVTMVEEVGAMGKGSLAATSLSSSLIVSSIFDVLCLMTLIYCGGAASVMNFAMREFAILFKYLGISGLQKRRKCLL